MSFLRDTRLTNFLEKSQAECAPKWMRVSGIVCLTALAALSVFALSVVLFHTEIGWFKRLLCLLLAAAILWYYIWVLKNFVRRTKR